VTEIECFASKWRGPYWLYQAGENDCEEDCANEHDDNARQQEEDDPEWLNEGGVYLWTARVDGRLFVYCVGEAAVFIRRIGNHRSDLISGRSYVYDPAMLHAGLLRAVHNQKKACLSGEVRLAVAREFGRMIGFYVLPFPAEKMHLRKRVEAALAYAVYEHPEASIILDQDWRHLEARPPGEPEVAVYGEQAERIVGVPSVIWA